LLYCKVEGKRFTHVIMIKGSFAEWNGRRFVSSGLANEIFEWVDLPGFATSMRSGVNSSQDVLASDFAFLDSMP
jgi:hypothetical protein